MRTCRRMRDYRKRSGGIYAGGYFTVEASYIFPIMVMVIVMVLRLGMEVHDDLADTALSQYLSVKEKSIEQSCYNPYEHRTDIREVVNTGIIEFSSTKKEVNKLYAEAMVREYRDNIALYTCRTKEMDKKKNCGLKNSTIVRTIHVIKSHAERIVEDD